MDIDEIDLKLDIHFIIKGLLSSKILDDRDLQFLELYLEGYSSREIANILGVDKDTVRLSIPNSLNLIRQKYNEILCNM